MEATATRIKGAFIVDELESRLKKEAGSFDKIVSDRMEGGKVPDIRRDFYNPYFYNSIWRSSKFVSLHYKDTFEWMSKNLKACNVSSVMEFGCGDGWASLELARMGFKVKGFDLSPESIRIASEYKDSLEEKKHLDLEYICGNALEFSEQLDSVLCHGFLHYLPNDYLDSFIKNVHDGMKPGQVMLITEPRYDSQNLIPSLLTYTFRKVFPNHFEYGDVNQDLYQDVLSVYNEIYEKDGLQSEMDNESPSEHIKTVVQKYFTNVQISHTNVFYDKVVGSMRVQKEDEGRLAEILKELDELILKYSPDATRSMRMVAIKNK